MSRDDEAEFDEELEEVEPVRTATEYISEAGYLKLAAERDELLGKERPQVVSQVAAAAAEGDRSENAEYIYGKKRLREIDQRISFLSRRLNALTPVARPGTDQRVVFLSWVQVCLDDERTLWFRLVGADEADSRIGWISYRSPVGRGLLGRSVGDEAVVATPGGERVYEVLQIAYNAPKSG